MRNKTLPYAKASIATRIARGIKMPKAVYKIAMEIIAMAILLTQRQITV